jgi:hypothetical protein
MDFLVESVLAIDEQDVDVLLREQASTLKSRKSRANNAYVIIRHILSRAKSFASQSTHAQSTPA